jgi:hypothetical protein
MSDVSKKWEVVYKDIRTILDKARSESLRTVNFVMVQAYWNIGRVIVEEEQKGKNRAEYGKMLIAELSKKLSIEYGRGFDQRNLWYMKSFYTRFQKVNALRAELTWTHYRLLLGIENHTGLRCPNLSETICLNCGMWESSIHGSSIFS